METINISIFWTVIGILVWPELTLCIILWKISHPILGIFALIFASTTNVKTIVREKIIDARTGDVLRETESTSQTKQ